MADSNSQTKQPDKGSTAYPQLDAEHQKKLDEAFRQIDEEHGIEHHGGIAYQRKADGTHKAMVGEIGPQSLHALQLATACEEWTDNFLASNFGVPRLANRDQVLTERAGFIKGEIVWSAALRRLEVTLISDPTQFPADFVGAVGINGARHPRLFHAVCLKDGATSTPSEPFKKEPTYEGYEDYMEQQVERIENINPARKNAKKSKELRQTLLQSDKPEEFRRAFFEHWIRPHYTPEALERRKRIHYANRTYLLVILSLAAHWWEKVGRDQAKKLGCWKAAPSSSLTSDQIAGATNPFPKAAQKVIQEIKRAHPSKVPVEMQFQLYVACGEDLTLFKTAITKNLGKSEKSVPRWIRNVQSKE